MVTTIQEYWSEVLGFLLRTVHVLIEGALDPCPEINGKQHKVFTEFHLLLTNSLSFEEVYLLHPPIPYSVICLINEHSLCYSPVVSSSMSHSTAGKQNDQPFFSLTQSTKLV